ncbi:LacI family transcriptional regulator [Ruminococcus sp. AF37-6AT]|nr:substrate-binding domain-containing protein [uncultured Blautia sp.]RGI64394.1 LacI family transcriptional regulator [Ruminococcus sp. TM10-9AT]RGW14107.1 LacI family transcriptional regulator [Ruminococcus sp. AF13-37]RGW22581.1 LacI family transcriptional regulator [Ruminococcus sp. AF13-28]RGY90019.1 LacI family transcriptional regulator [Ruminococcus sp. AM58-7XD]RHG52197.1 LacI family transcriptional regulator [Ruminococcus sp. AM22-13]RHJ99869.1 LacI family transcriptional regulator 
MKRAVVAAISLMTGLTMLTGCSKAEVEETIQPLVADAIEESDSEAEAVDEQDESPLIPEIDTDVKIEAGSRIAVVSKSVKGEYWKMVKKGMEDAVKAINDAYGFKKDDQITMTFEGPDNEEDVESQINTIDAVIAENPDVLCISASDMDSCQAQLEAAKENEIPVVAFDSNVSEKKLVKAYRGTDNVQVGKMAAYQLGSALGKMGKVAVFSAQQKTKSVQDRVDGFMNNIQKYGDIEVVEVIYSDQVDDMETAMKEVLDKYPALDGVFCTNADVTELYLGLEKSDAGDAPALVGVDATTKQQEAIRNGEEIGCVSQQSYAMGYQTIWTAAETTAPKKSVTIEKNLLLNPAWIDSESVDDPDSSAYLYTE